MMSTAYKSSPFTVVVFGNTPKPIVLNAFDDLEVAERARKEWLASYAHRADRPTVGIYQRIDTGSEASLLAALRQLAARIKDRRARVHIEAAIQDVQEWRAVGTPPRVKPPAAKRA